MQMIVSMGTVKYLENFKYIHGKKPLKDWKSAYSEKMVVTSKLRVLNEEVLNVYF